jgi:acyl transferase domain-containing protein/NAD(P)-dependent dehydrogenase (short-subunit alcohol dehydrogenase family)/acyl carrier protein
MIKGSALKKNIKNKDNNRVAIIGMGCFFPKASGLKEYWRLLSRGQDAIDRVPETHWSPDDFYDKDPKTPDHVYCRRGGFLSSISFDPTEFGIPPSILEATDTSQLLGLVAAKTALEDAGYGGGRPFNRNKTSVILGVTGTQELVIPLGARLGHPIWRRALKAAGVPPEQAEAVVERIAEGYVSWQENSFPGLLGNVIPGRISNRLNLGGTNCAVDAACASSMSAMHLALMELLTGRADMAVTGGVDTLNDIFMHMCFSKTPILSPTEDVRPFSKDADGSILGEGIGIMVFKRLEDAERDGDRIYAVIRGVGTSSDGRSNSIYAPLAEGQMAALRRAYEQAGIHPQTIELIESHGTGTRVGDAVEFKGLNLVFSGQEDADAAAPPRNWCALGSVKSMIGHTKAAAGAAGLIKTVLSLYHKVLPPTLKVGEPDPDLGISDSPFYLNTQARPWLPKEHPRRAGVSAFGFGGSNFHMVLEEYQREKTDVSWDGSVEIVALSGATPEDIQASLHQLKEDIQQGMSDEDIAVKAAETRSRFSPNAPHRILLVLEKAVDRFVDIAETVSDALDAFQTNLQQQAWNMKNVFYGGPEGFGKLAFVFPGQGSQYVDMGRDLACRFPEAIETLDRLDRSAGGPGGISSLIYPRPAFNGKDKQELTDRLKRTDAAQPALGAVCALMFKILRRFGLMPDAVCGHSFGELSALYAAGWIDMETLFNLAFIRGKLMNEAGQNTSGAMLAVKAPLAEIETFVQSEKLDVILANRNSPEQGILSGSVQAIETAERMLHSRNIPVKRLPVSGAFHSEFMKAAHKSFVQALEKIGISPSDIPVFSNATGAAYPRDPEKARGLLADQILSPVDFVKEIKNLFDMGVRTFVEVGPMSVLTGLILSILKGFNIHAISLDASSGRRFGMADLARLLCHLAALGHPVDLKNWEDPPPRRRKQRMQVPICGANYRSSKKENKRNTKQAPLSSRPTAPAEPVVSKPAAGVTENEPRTTIPSLPRPDSDRPQEVQTQTRQTLPEKQPPIFAEPPGKTDLFAKSDVIHTGTRSMNPKDHPLPPAGHHGAFLSEAFRAVQEGLKSMQALQTQTAETHKKFLESQTYASQTLQRMMENTQRLAEVSLGIRPPAGPSVPDRFLHENMPEPIREPVWIPEVPNPESPVVSPPQTPLNPVSSSLKNAISSVDRPASPSLSIAPVFQTGTPPAGNGRSKVETAMLEVVSNLTGYPVDMLSLDMDIEADLGIDSIKRVEILSTFEEKMPDTPAVSPEIMGTLKTLGQIVEYLVGARPSEHSSPPVLEPAGWVPPGKTERIRAALLQVVSELTGYPSDMLSLDMDIEADLGIDSIKRVEILSAFEEKMPDMPAVSPEIMGTLKTLGQIVEYLAGPSAEPESFSSAHAPEPASPEADGIQAALLGVVSDLTGYPTDMLSLDMDIEADLGIDSIKRVEILSAFEERMPDLPSVSPEIMGTLKTLGQIVEYLRTQGSETVCLPASDSLIRHSKFQNLPDPSVISSQVSAELVKKKHIRLVRKDFDPGASVIPSADRPVFITQDRAGLANALADVLAGKGAATMLASPESMIQGDLSKAGGLVILADAWKTQDDRFIKAAFALARKAGPGLLESGARGGALFAAVSRMDGGFGFKGTGFSNAFQGGLAGLVKTAAIEWESVCCHALDIPESWRDPSAAAPAIVREMIQKGPAEVGLGPDGRFVPALEPADYPQGQIRLKPGDLVVVTGGARGVTAAAVRVLAAQVPCTFLLIGRSSLPSDEPSWLAGLTDGAAMKKAILSHDFSSKTPKPAELEKAYQKYIANREVYQNIEQIRASGAAVLYRSADVRDPEAVRRILDEARSLHGPVRALIHGAGTLEDRFIVDKTPEQFERVFDTKVKGFENLLAAALTDDLTYLILFSSVAGRMGNKGQADYAMANEVLNKMAQLEALKRPGCRVISLNWGPWDGGMVTPALKREFERIGIELIPPDAGARSMAAEMRGGSGSPVEVVMGAGLTRDEIKDPSKAEVEDISLCLSFKREIDPDRLPILKSHILNGRPAVPFSLMTEWMAHGAIHENPGLFLYGLEDIHFLKDIPVDNELKLLRLMAGKARRKGDVYETPVELRNGLQEGADMILSRAKALLADTPTRQAPAFTPPINIRMKSYPRTREEIYGTILSRGEALQGIQEVMTCSEKGVAARISTAPPPERWMTDPLRSQWISDPLIQDAAFQMAALWSFEYKGRIALPSRAEAYHQYNRFLEDSVMAVLEVTGADGQKMKGDFTFLDAEDRVVARLTGFEMVYE